MLEFITPERTPALIRSCFLVFVVLPVIFIACRLLKKYLEKIVTAQQSLIITKLIQYGSFMIVLIMVIKEFGFSLTPLLGAAGIAGIALGFASKTSISNMICGVFIIIEKPFQVGDTITVSQTTGIVISIDFLSVKLRTFDNQFVRIPNETILQSAVTNKTCFPIRRADLTISVAYKEDIANVKQILEDIAFTNPLCLIEPEPLIIFLGFNASSIDFQFSVWAKRTDFLKLKNTIMEEVKQRFDQAGVEIPFPHTSLYTGQATKPFPIEIVQPSIKEPTNNI